MAEIYDYYQALEVRETASSAEIKRAYRSLAQTLHPDRNPDDEQAERFRIVKEAYDVLSEPETRLWYDRMRKGETGGTRARGVSIQGSVRITAERRKPLEQGAYEIEVRLSFEQALQGTTVDIQLQDGATVPIPVPPGVRSGVTVRCKGKGGPGASGEARDLHVRFRVMPSPRFRREGNDLHIVEPITVLDAMLGTQRAITSAYGQHVKITIPPGTQAGERFRLKGQGVATRGQRGDLYIEVCLTVPRSLTEQQRATLAACARELGLQ